VGYFRIMLGGTGIDIPSDEKNGPPIIGFFTARLVMAATAAEAEKRAKDMVLSEWSSGEYARANKGSMPILTVESVQESSLSEKLRSKNKGYSFYMQEDKEKIGKSA
jgi:hypothetical protein